MDKITITNQMKTVNKNTTSSKYICLHDKSIDLLLRCGAPSWLITYCIQNIALSIGRTGFSRSMFDLFHAFSLYLQIELFIIKSLE